MHKAPANLIKNTEEFTNAIRQAQLPTQESIARYHGFIRGNIYGVIDCSFPEFSNQITTEEKEQLVNQFLALHHSTEPEFHHIATEFVRFVQAHKPVNQLLTCLLEYEWVLFNAEIDNHKVTKTELNIAETVTNHQTLIKTNPTLNCIELPFCVETPIHLEQAEQPFFYGIFRDVNNEVLYKKLSPQDIFIINNINQQQECTYSALKKCCLEFFTEEVLLQWLNNAQSMNLITIAI